MSLAHTLPLCSISFLLFRANEKAQYTAPWHLDAISIDPEIQLSCKQAMMAKKEEEIRHIVRG